jgi:hypothetical protein
LVFVDDVFIRFGVASGVVDVPAERFAEGIEKFAAKLGFVVLAGFVGFEVALETVDQVENFFWGGHADGRKLKILFGRRNAFILAAVGMDEPVGYFFVARVTTVRLFSVKYFLAMSRTFSGVIVS